MLHRKWFCLCFPASKLCFVNGYLCKSLGENCDNLPKCILEAFGIMVKRVRLQSDNLAFLPNYWVALDKFPQITEAPCRLG